MNAIYFADYVSVAENSETQKSQEIAEIDHVTQLDPDLELIVPKVPNDLTKILEEIKVEMNFLKRKIYSLEQKNQKLERENIQIQMKLFYHEVPNFGESAKFGDLTEFILERNQ